MLEGHSFYDFSVGFGLMYGNGVITIGYRTTDPENQEIRAGASEMALMLVAEALAKKGGA